MPDHKRHGLGAPIWLLGCTSILVLLSIKLGHTSLYVVTALSAALLVLSIISALKSRISEKTYEGQNIEEKNKNAPKSSKRNLKETPVGETTQVTKKKPPKRVRNMEI
jgi:uncharacterized membrane protein